MILACKQVIQNKGQAGESSKEQQVGLEHVGPGGLEGWSRHGRAGICMKQGKCEAMRRLPR